MPKILDKKPAICAAISGSTIDEFIDALKEAKGANIIEIRADGLEEPSTKKVRKLLETIRSETKLPLILTNRVIDEGGAFSGTEEERIKILEENMELADAVDIELSTEKKRRDELVETAKKKGITVILSSHDFEKTPDKATMIKTIAQEIRAGADIAKIAVTAKTKKDVLRLLKVTQEAAALGNICTISMGEKGKLSRVIAPLFGSCITYASAGKPTAPGQLSTKEVKTAMEILK